MGSQGLTRVVDVLFADMNGRYVFNYLDDRVVYCLSVNDHMDQVRVLLQPLKEA